jgi:hypothetical protein
MKFTNIPRYSQRSWWWSWRKLGFSNVTIGGYGCTVTCISMLAKMTPDKVNEALKKVNGFAFGNLVNWTKIHQAIPQLDFVWRNVGYNNVKVKQAISDYGACLVETWFDKSKKGKHWVLFVGNKRMIDPWTGQEMSTSTYPDLTGYAIIKPV